MMLKFLNLNIFYLLPFTLFFSSEPADMCQCWMNTWFMVEWLFVELEIHMIHDWMVLMKYTDLD